MAESQTRYIIAYYLHMALGKDFGFKEMHIWGTRGGISTGSNADAPLPHTQAQLGKK